MKKINIEEKKITIEENDLDCKEKIFRFKNILDDLSHLSTVWVVFLAPGLAHVGEEGGEVGVTVTRSIDHLDLVHPGDAAVRT